MELEEEQLIKKKIRINRMKLVADIILIIVLIGIFSYVYSEIENFKALKGNVCRLCEQKTGGTCVLNYVPPTPTTKSKYSEDELNVSTSWMEH